MTASDSPERIRTQLWDLSEKAERRATGSHLIGSHRQQLIALCQLVVHLHQHLQQRPLSSAHASLVTEQPIIPRIVPKHTTGIHQALAHVMKVGCDMRGSKADSRGSKADSTEDQSDALGWRACLLTLCLCLIPLCRHDLVDL